MVRALFNISSKGVDYINLKVLYLLLYQATCSEGSCISDGTCTVNGATCECNAGYYPEVTTTGTCTRK